MTKRIDFQTDPSQYRHWRVEYDGPIANLFMDVDEDGGLFDGYQLKLNSYDLGVDIELADVVQRMRFEHPEVKVVVMQSAKDKVFCAGANIRMLGGAAHSIRSTSASSRMKRATPTRRPWRTVGRTISVRSKGRARAAGTSWLWPVITSCSPTIHVVCVPARGSVVGGFARYWRVDARHGQTQNAA